jgi:hypothetical protein
MTWTEELELLPPGYGPGHPQVELLADANTFYCFVVGGETLYRAGATIEEVYWGMKKGAWLFSNEPQDSWIEMADTGEEYECWDYFPLWDGFVKKDGTHAYKPVFPLYRFVPRERLIFGSPRPWEHPVGDTKDGKLIDSVGIPTVENEPL